MTFINTKDVGPIIVDIPPTGDDGSVNANFVDVWQTPLEHGGRFGVDKRYGPWLHYMHGAMEEVQPAFLRT
jgi:hypothetical protein